MIYAKPPNLNNLKKYVIFYHIIFYVFSVAAGVRPLRIHSSFDIFVGALWLQISALFYIDFSIPFKKQMFDFRAKRIPKLDPRALPERSQNASASQNRFLIDVASISVPILAPFSRLLMPLSVPVSLLWSWPHLQTTENDSPVSQGSGGYAPRLQ